MLTAQDKIECSQIAANIIERVLAKHIETCPHHQAYMVLKARAVGIALGIILASGISSGTMAALIMKTLGY